VRAAAEFGPLQATGARARAQESLCLAAPASVLPALAGASALTALRHGDAGLMQVRGRARGLTLRCRCGASHAFSCWSS